MSPPVFTHIPVPCVLSPELYFMQVDDGGDFGGGDDYGGDFGGDDGGGGDW